MKFLTLAIYLALSIATFVMAGLHIDPVFIGLIWAVLIVINLFAFRPELGVYATAFFLPVIGWWFDFGPLSVPFIDIVALLSGAGFFFHWIFFKADRRLAWPHLWPFAILLAAFVAASFAASHPLASLWYSVRWILFFYAFYIFVPVNVITDRAKLKTMLLFFVLSGLAVSAMGLWSLTRQDLSSTLTRIKPVSIFGVYPLEDNQNLIAEVLLPAAFYALALSLWVKHRTAKRILFVVAGFLVLVMLGTFSRAAWIGFAAAFVFYIANRRRYFDNTKHVALVISVMLLIIPLSIYMIKLRGNFSVGQSSNESRLLLTQISLEKFSDRPVFGYGPGEYLNLINDNIRFRAKYGPPLESHGFIQKLLAETGAIGFGAFAFFVSSIAWGAWRTYRQVHNEYSLLLMMAAALSIFIMQLFNTSYYKGKLWLPVALVIIVGNLYKRKLKENEIR